MIRAIIFDFFGVLAVRGTASFRKTYFAGDNKKNARAEKLNDQLNRGDLGYDQFITELAKLGGVERETVLTFTENYQPDKQLVDYIHQNLKLNFKIGIISNAGADWVLKILGPENLKLFDDIVLSYKTGFIKPESEIYQLSAINLGVKTEECIFTDDILSYCQGAEVVGMNTIWYQSFEQFKKELEDVLSSSSNN